MKYMRRARKYYAVEAVREEGGGQERADGWMKQ